MGDCQLSTAFRGVLFLHLDSETSDDDVVTDTADIAQDGMKRMETAGPPQCALPLLEVGPFLPIELPGSPFITFHHRTSKFNSTTPQDVHFSTHTMAL